jgi:hypothetical protein
MAKRKKVITRGSRKTKKAGRLGKVPTKKTKRQVPAAQRSPDRRRTAAAIERLRKAQAVAAARADDLLAVAHDLGKAAVAKVMDDMAAELVDRQLLRDLIALQVAFDQAQNALPEDMGRLNLVPEALLGWLADRFDLVPDLKPGQEMTVSVSRLVERFDVASGQPAPATGPVRIRVLEAGWKRGGKCVVRPHVAVLQDGAVSEPASTGEV